MSGRLAASGYGALGDFFFHFTKADTAFRFIVPSGQLLFRSYALMDDPLESKEWHFELRDVEDEAYEQLGDLVIDALNVARTHGWLVSFTVDAPHGDGPLEAAFARGYARARLWEQYGDRHAGVCLCFEQRFERLIRAGSSPSRPVTSGSVRYTAAGSAGSPARNFDGRVVNAVWAEIKRALGRYDRSRDGDFEVFRMRVSAPALERLIDAVNAHATKHLDDFLFLKTTDWESEHEHRIVVGKAPEADEDGVLVPYGDTLAAVIVGERLPSQRLPAARAACAERGVDLLQMDWVRGIPTPRRVGG